ncbi:MAG TPA: secretin N-terminal domain-containing protein [bacterium]|nr:secretin N-terminal domain-containing protein [bacterium]
MRTLLALLTVLTLGATMALAAPTPARPAATGVATLTVDLVDVPLTDALSILARTAHINLVVQGAMTGTVTLRVANQTVDQALAVLASTYRLDVSRVGPTYIVRQLAGDAIRIAPAQVGSSDVVVRTYNLRYALASEVASEIRTLLGVSPATNTQQATVIGQPPTAPQGGGSSGAGSTTGTGTTPTNGGTGAPSGGGYTAPTSAAPPASTAPSSPSQATGGQATQKGVAVASDDRTNSITVAASFDLQVQVQDAILRLDRPTGGPQIVTPHGSNAPAPQTGSSSGDPVVGARVSNGTYRYDIRYADPQSMASAVLNQVNGVTVLVDLRTNSLYVTGDSGLQRQVSAILSTLDSPSVQIMIQTEILDISKSASSNLGIQWSWQPFSLSQIATGNQLQGSGVYPIVATLNTLVTQGEGRVLANPQVSTQNGVQATINVGETLYIPVTTTTNGVSTTTLTTVNAGILLLVTPRLNGNGMVTNSLNVQANSISGYTPQGYPDITQRSVSSIITVHDGEPILIGGLISDSTTKAIQKIPVLGDLPLVGSLFKYTTTDHTYDNIVMILTPRLITPRNGAVLGSGTH